MSVSCMSGAIPAVCAGSALLALAVTGCPWSAAGRRPAPPISETMPDERPLDTTSPEQPAPSRAVLELLGGEDWIRAVSSPGEPSSGGSAYRWRYPALEKLLSRPGERHPDLHKALARGEPVVAANAAIFLARSGDASGVDQLAATVRASQRKLPLRLAAAEALGSLRDPAVPERLAELLDQFGRVDPGHGGPYLPELHAELIRGLGRHVNPAGNFRFVEALRSRSARVRLAALQPWTDRECGELPVEVIDRRTDPDPRVRAAVMKALARQRHSRAREYLAAALRDHDLQVRTAAIAALGRLGGNEAEATLAGALHDDAPLIREAAVSALGQMGATDAVLRATGDESWRVRAAVARALARHPTADTTAAAHKLLNDPSTVVRRDLLRAIGRWPLCRAGPILLEAMASPGYQTRHTAAAELARRWSPAAEFPADGPAERRAEALNGLGHRFEAEFGRTELGIALEPAIRDPAVRPAAAVEPASPPTETDAAVDVLLERLTSEDVSVRREAAAALAELTGGQPLGRSAGLRLAAVAVSESDPLVWQSVLEAIRGDGSEPSIRLAYAAISHDSAEVRRRACEHLASHADPKHAAVLLPALDDPAEAVRFAAVAALAAGGELENPEPLERLLTSSDGRLRVAAATALCRVGDPSGPAALERLTLSRDPAIRREAAAAMGEIADPSFAGALVRLLDDRPNVRAAALESLPKVAGRDVGETPDGPATDDARRIELWKAWHGQLSQGPSVPATQ